MEKKTRDSVSVKSGLKCEAALIITKQLIILHEGRVCVCFSVCLLTRDEPSHLFQNICEKNNQTTGEFCTSFLPSVSTAFPAVFARSPIGVAFQCPWLNENVPYMIHRLGCQWESWSGSAARLLHSQQHCRAAAGWRRTWVHLLQIGHKSACNEL